MSIQLVIIISYIFVLFGISIYVKRRTENSSGFLFAGRKLTSTLIAANIAGTAIGAASTIGTAENAFQFGIAAGWYNVAWAAGAVTMALVAAEKYRGLNCTTIPELFERYYDKKGRAIAVLGMITIQLVITSLQYIAGGAILSALLPDIFSLKGGMITSAVVFIGTTILGGLWSSGLSNILSTTLIYIGVLTSTLTIVAKQGGMSTIAASLPPGVDWFGPVGGFGSATIIGWFVVMMTQTITAQGPVQIACAAVDKKSAKRGFLWGAVLMFPIGFACAVMGIAAKVAYPEMNATMALPQMIMGLDPVVAGLTLAALWAADVATACHILLAAGTLFSQDIYKRFYKPDIDDQQYTLVNRCAILVLGAVTLWFAFNAVGIVKTMLIGLSLTTAFTLVFLFTMFAPQFCRKNTAFYTTFTGIATLVVWQVVPSFRLFAHPIYMEWVVCLLTFFIVALVDKNKITSDEAKSYMVNGQTPGFAEGRN
ncbi:sodium:solute symporter family protein [Sporomusa acidovorans]|uniref:Sodium/glucose cotransporter n=1 Tax=Sporomusa acidovorans (strain ATCC 49682 / DSM 3132 / Mol) TaxID=1123286 RepID=A0ABZ3J202_SPOA4|nr:sodium:solute symporter family protein [Sporomusa acidovorans]OZC15760.1 sodium/glucose cotransporter [Sporomusa acidovorans DSM 3132]SDF62949.1 solute:Na+ symporter, SSS family [Sporomusa acidovorans]